MVLHLFDPVAVDHEEVRIEHQQPGGLHLFQRHVERCGVVIAAATGVGQSGVGVDARDDLATRMVDLQSGGSGPGIVDDQQLERRVRVQRFDQRQLLADVAVVVLQHDGQDGEFRRLRGLANTMRPDPDRRSVLSAAQLGQCLGQYVEPRRIAGEGLCPAPRQRLDGDLVSGFFRAERRPFQGFHDA